MIFSCWKTDDLEELSVSVEWRLLSERTAVLLYTGTTRTPFLVVKITDNKITTFFEMPTLSHLHHINVVHTVVVVMLISIEKTDWWALIGGEGLVTCVYLSKLFLYNVWRWSRNLVNGFKLLSRIQRAKVGTRLRADQIEKATTQRTCLIYYTSKWPES